MSRGSATRSGSTSDKNTASPDIGNDYIVISFEKDPALLGRAEKLCREAGLTFHVMGNRMKIKTDLEAKLQISQALKRWGVKI